MLHVPDRTDIPRLRHGLTYKGKVWLAAVVLSLAAWSLLIWGAVSLLG